MQEQIVERHPDADLAMQFVWVSAFKDDSLETADALRATVGDERATHYWDPEGLVGTDVSEGMDFVAPSMWDVYMFYDGDAVWTDVAPQPMDWAHQMPEIDTAQYKPNAGGVFAEYLAERMTAWGFAPP